MRYEFQCSGCGKVKEFFASIHDGPPSGVTCECGSEMIHQLGTNFILKGDGWAGKDLREHKMGKSREENDAQLAEDSRNQRIVEEVTAVRRQGTEASRKLKESNPQKMKDYKAAIKKGYRAKPKSYEVKAK